MVDINERIDLTEEELAIVNRLQDLKKGAGTHSPSMFSILESIKEINIKVDSCFLSNPYATDLFIEYFNKELLETGNIRDLLEFYPSQNNIIAKKLAKSLKINADNIFIGNGAIEIIQALIHNYTHSKIIVNIPTFSSYYEYVKDGIEIVYNRLKKELGYELEIDQYIDLCKKEKPDTIILINPNNPNGAYVKYSDVIRLLDNLSDVENIIIDESFIHFAYEDSRLDLVSFYDLIHIYPNLTVIKSMSKDFGIAGIRAGYGIMSKEKVDHLLKNGYLWNSNGLAEYFFSLYVREDFNEKYLKIRKDYIKITQEFINELQTIKDIKIINSKANFVLVELPEGLDSSLFASTLLVKFGIYVRDCSDKIGLEGSYLRIASRTKEENDYIVDSLKELFK